MFNLDRSAKSIIAGAIAGFGALAAGYDDSVLTSSERIAAIGAGLAALAGVWAFSNLWAKTGIAAAIAGISSLAVAIKDDRVSAQEWVTIILAVLTALYSVYTIPNTNAPSSRSQTPG